MTEQNNLLKRAVDEIRSLRSRNQLMAARLDMFDTMVTVLQTNIAQRGQGMAPDLTYEIDKFLDNQSAKVSGEHPFAK